jgi:hypothetical protein
MPQPRKSSQKSSGSTSSRRSAGGTRKSTSGSSSSRSSGASRSSDARVEALAERVRKLNERIIEAGRDAGETTLSAYERALKTIAASMERGAGASDIEWLSQLLNTQAKFIRDITNSWTSAARGVLK